MNLFRLHNKNSFPSKLGPTNVCYLKFKTVNLRNLFFHDQFPLTSEQIYNSKAVHVHHLILVDVHIKISVDEVYKFLREVVYLFCNKINSWERKEQGSIETSEKRVQGEGQGGRTNLVCKLFPCHVDMRAAGGGVRNYGLTARLLTGQFPECRVPYYSTNILQM